MPIRIFLKQGLRERGASGKNEQKKKKEKIRRSMKNLCRFVESYKDFTLYGYRFHSKIKHKFCTLSSSFLVLFFCPLFLPSSVAIEVELYR
ncbi:BAG_1a_G0018230.mRNA.1.CDS.1 [Saccharomyces cerevisiae]|nr:SX2_G0036920.mRNA.1.CDS.1 [Saccharomyces cerevisiae]CAI4470796.1 BAG_1a_G0018230.mRNA.1.CDS.1 [Saccharomyces cerevisiae]CAI7118962.1 BAG_1a_G0018230.mRNA.1.CDS.1 [Saccharomyces cerevisiae]